MTTPYVDVGQVLNTLNLYSNKPRVIADCNNLRAQIGQSLVPKKDTLVQNDGRQQHLLKMSGTIPVTFRGATYWIPVDLWIPEAYPLRAPICYVTPTRDMRIKPQHRHVDLNGVVYLPYLSNWASSCNLTGAVTTMQRAFGEDPPVFSVQSQPQPVQPAYGGYPQGQPVQGQPIQGQPIQGQPVQNQHPGGPYRAPSYPAYGPAAGAGYPQPQQQPYGQGAFAQPPAYGNGPSPSWPYGPPNPALQPGRQEEDRKAAEEKKKRDEEAKIKAEEAAHRKKVVDELTTVLLQELSEYNKKENTAINAAYNNTEKLKRGEEDITENIKQLDAQTEALAMKEAEMESYTSAASQWIATNDGAKVDPDTAVFMKDTWAQQLVEAVAEDQAIGDCLDELSKAVTDERLSTSDFLKHVRMLSRRQFMCRALALKIYEKQHARIK